MFLVLEDEFSDLAFRIQNFFLEISTISHKKVKRLIS